jgi:signal transduction histidine kinase
MPFANKIACIFFLFSFISFAQTKEMDSLFRYSKYKQLDTLLFQSDSLEDVNLKLAKVKYHNTFKNLEESFRLLFDIDTTLISSSQKAHYYYNLGKAYDLNASYDLAAMNFKTAQKYFNRIGDLRSYNSIHLDLYYTMFDPDIYSQPVDYLEKYQELAIELNDPLQLVNLEIELAFVCEKSQDSTAHYLTHINNAYEYFEQDPDPHTLSVIYSFHAFYYTDVIVQKDSAEVYYNKALDIHKEMGLSHKVAIDYFSLGDINRLTGDFEKAIYWTKKANSYRNFNYDYELTAYINEKLADDYKQLQNLDSAYHYLNLAIQFRDSLNRQKQNINLTRFQAQKKEQENLILEQQNEKNEAFIVGTVGALVLLSFLSFSVYMNAKRKRLLIEKDKALEIEQIETQLKIQQLKALDALVIGQERERMRIASDLHDNIGSNFVAIKSYFHRLKEEYDKESKTSPVFDKTSILLEETYQDIRSLAHLKHSGLMRDDGLLPAIRKLCKNVSSFSQIEVEFHSFIDADIELNERLELNVFRIIQESMANVVKHSKANKASISITSIDSLLNIIVEDDGVGFDEHQISQQDSFGLQSIKERLELLKGKFTIDTKKGRGTTVIIDIPL